MYKLSIINNNPLLGDNKMSNRNKVKALFTMLKGEKLKIFNIDNADIINRLEFTVQCNSDYGYGWNRGFSIEGGK